MKTIVRALVFSLAMLAALTPLPCLAQSDETTSLFLKANELYKENNYQKAAEIYESLIGNGFQNGHLYYNLGNTYIRLGSVGKAILNYLHAQKFLPRDQDLQANLKYAVQDTVDVLDWQEQSLMATFFFWADDFNLREHLTALVFVNTLFWIFMCAWLYRRTETMNQVRKVMLAILILAMISTMVKWRIETSRHFGVILAANADIKSGMGKDRVTLFKLHEGAVVSIEQEDAEWYRIKIKDGKSGWAKKSAVGT